jgi:hypothetical protein
MKRFDYVKCEKNYDGEKLCPNCGIPFNRWEFGRNEPYETYLYFSCGLLLHSIIKGEINTNRVVSVCQKPTPVNRMTEEQLLEYVHQLIRESYAS